MCTGIPITQRIKNYEAKIAELELQLKRHENSLSEDELRQVTLHLTQALGYVDNVIMTKNAEVSYETMQKSGFNRKRGWRRSYTLKDARSDASCAAIQLRQAWELLDPIGK